MKRAGEEEGWRWIGGDKRIGEDQKGGETSGDVAVVVPS